MSSHSRSEVEARPENDDLVYTGVYRALVIGMITSNILFAIGTVLVILRRMPAGQIPLGGGNLSHFLHGLTTADPIAILALATVVLILTPISRVVVSIYAFARARDHRFTAITAFVLLTITVTIILGVEGVLK